MFDTCGYSEYLKARNYALLLVMLDTGVRRSEVVAMKLQDVNWKNRTIKIHGKGKKERIVPFGVRTSLALKKYLLYHPRICDNVWLTEELTPLHSRGLQSFFRRLKYRAGISDRRCSAHDMRHTFACMILNNGASMKTTQDLLGHADQTSTEIYTEPAQLLKMMREYEQASPVERLNMYKQRWK
jgi:site-specific recombinase XerD